MREKVLTTLKEVRDLLAESSRWTKGHFAKKSKLGYSGVPVNSVEATCWCLEGACLLKAPSVVVFRKVIESLAVEIGEISPPDISFVVEWNDREGRTHQEVLELLDRTIEKGTTRRGRSS